MLLSRIFRSIIPPTLSTASIIRVGNNGVVECSISSTGQRPIDANFVYDLQTSSDNTTWADTTIAGQSFPSANFGRGTLGNYYRWETRLNSDSFGEPSASVRFLGFSPTITETDPDDFSIEVTWTNWDATLETKVIVDGSTVHTAAAGVTTYEITGLDVETFYEIYVQHVTPFGDGPLSAMVTASTTLPPPAISTGIFSISPSADTVTLNSFNVLYVAPGTWYADVTVREFKNSIEVQSFVASNQDGTDPIVVNSVNDITNPVASNAQVTYSFAIRNISDNSLIATRAAQVSYTVA